MKSKEEIVQNFIDKHGWGGFVTGNDLSNIIYPSMDEYAKEVAIAALIEFGVEKINAEFHVNRRIESLNQPK